MIPARTIRWADWAGAEAGLEHCEIGPEGEGLAVAAVVAGTIDGERFGLSYRLTIGPDWRVQRAELRSTAGRVLVIEAARAGWLVDGSPIPALAGCLDIDIRATPLTNMLPIRRLGLEPGGSAGIGVAFVSVPDLTVTPGRQRYTRLEDRLWRFESLESGFAADLPVDRDGLVLDYPGLFRRVG